MNEALYALQEGAATPEEIDQAVCEFGLPMGPFTLLDMTGLDICGHVNEFLYSQYGPRFETAPLLKAMLKAGHLGQKSGAGFYLHERGEPAKKDQPKKLNPRLADLIREIQKTGGKQTKSFDVYRVILPMFNEAVYTVQEQVVAPQDVDVAMKFGCGLQRGLFSIAEEKGLDWCLAALENNFREHGERFRPAWLLRQLVQAGVHDFSKLDRAPAAVR
jgi:3-hydroxyacyl-CoA dehydrogenase